MFRSILCAILVVLAVSTAASAGEMKLGWTFKDDDGNSGVGQFKFLKVKIVRDKLQFDVIVHNPRKDTYQCFLLQGDDKSSYMDDEFGNEYKGIRISVKGSTGNKLAPNQRKRLSLSIAAPEKDVTLVNIHFGLWIRYLSSSENNESCKENNRKMVDRYGFNFHKLDWDVSGLR